MIGPADQQTRVPRPPRADSWASPAPGAVVAAVAGLVAGWIAAGSIGLIGHALRRGLVWIALGGALAAALTSADRRGRLILSAVLALAAAVPAIASELRVLNVLAVVLVLSAVAAGHQGASRNVLRHSAEAVFLLVLFRFALTAIPLVWLSADAVGAVLGKCAAFLTRQPLWVGATFAGLDFLIVMLYLAFRATGAAGSRRASDSANASEAIAQPTSSGVFGGPARRRALAVGVVLIGHFIYLNVLSWAPDIRDRMPLASPPGTPWNPYPSPPGFEAAVRRWTYGDPTREGEPALHEPAVRFVLRGLFAAGQAVRRWIPWNLPAWAAIIHACVAVLLFRWFGACGDVSERHLTKPTTRRHGLALTASAVLAALLPVVSVLSLHRPSLDGKKIVLFEEGFLNWEKPKHGDTSLNYGQYAIGMYGMSPIYLQSLGLHPIRSADLSEADLDGASVVVLIFPDKPWKPGQLDRIRRFVASGGSLLVLGEHTILDAELLKSQDEALGNDLAALHEKLKSLQFKRAGASRETIGEIIRQESALRQAFDERVVAERLAAAAWRGPLNRFNEALDLSDIHVRFDSATFAVGGWLQSYQALSHPTTVGLADARNAFGVVIGASLHLRWPRAARWPAWPLLIGLWGWGDPGNALNYPSMMAKSDEPSSLGPRYDPGERLGDLVLAAEQRIGKGRIVVFGDTSSFTNGVNLGAHEFTSRLFAYLADPSASPYDRWRQVAAVLIVVAAAALVLFAQSEAALALAAVALGTSLAICTATTHQAWTVFPDGRAGGGKANNLAYIDEAHLGHFSPESWREEGLMGLCMNLMRNDYLCLMMPTFSRERLLDGDEKPRARLLVSVAPARPYSATERQTIRDFVSAGGVFVTTVGYDEAGPSRPLLEEFGFYVGGRRWQWVDRGSERAGIVHFKAGSSPANWDDALAEPKPLGHFKSPYFNGGDYLAYVRFHAAWPLECEAPNHLPVSFYPPDVPVTVIRRYGLGLVTVVSDTAFAQNRNLENRDGSPFEGMRENAVFWRWLVAMLRDGMGEGERWFPKKSDTVPIGLGVAAREKTDLDDPDHDASDRDSSDAAPDAEPVDAEPGNTTSDKATGNLTPKTTPNPTPKTIPKTMPNRQPIPKS